MESSSSENDFEALLLIEKRKRIRNMGSSTAKNKTGARRVLPRGKGSAELSRLLKNILNQIQYTDIFECISDQV